MFCQCDCDCMNYLTILEDVICNNCYFGDHTWDEDDDSWGNDEDW